MPQPQTRTIITCEGMLTQNYIPGKRIEGFLGEEPEKRYGEKRRSPRNIFLEVLYEAARFRCSSCTLVAAFLIMPLF